MRLREVIERADRHPRLHAAAQALRRRLPGDDRYGDPLSLGRDAPVGIVFTDLAGFSSWALEAGDDSAVELLRAVGRTVEPLVAARGGTVVKRLGDGLMAVFDDADAAVDAAWEASSAVEDLEVAGYRPRMRAAVHIGRPRRLGGDFYGVDVNVAARIGAEAAAGEVLISNAVCERLDESRVELRRRWRFRAKGAPADIQVFRVKRWEPQAA